MTLKSVFFDNFVSTSTLTITSIDPNRALETYCPSADTGIEKHSHEKIYSSPTALGPSVPPFLSPLTRFESESARRAHVSFTRDLWKATRRLEDAHIITKHVHSSTQQRRLFHGLNPDYLGRHQDNIMRSNSWYVAIESACRLALNRAIIHYCIEEALRKDTLLVDDW